MLDLWRRSIKVVKQRFPLLILCRAPEVAYVIFDRLPVNEQNVPRRLLDALLQLMIQVRSPEIAGVRQEIEQSSKVGEASLREIRRIELGRIEIVSRLVV
jgi:hypothetical protein